MAMRRSTRGRTRWRGTKSPLRWTSQLADNSPIENNALSQFVLVATSDYASNTNLEPVGVTLVRIRGFLTYAPTLAATVHSLWAAIFMHDTDEVPVLGGLMDPSGFQELIDEQVLWWGSGICLNGSGASQLSVRFHEIDVKAKRRLKDSAISLVVRTTGGVAGVTGQLTMSARSLLRGSAT